MPTPVYAIVASALAPPKLAFCFSQTLRAPFDNVVVDEYVELAGGRPDEPLLEFFSSRRSGLSADTLGATEVDASNSEDQVDQLDDVVLQSLSPSIVECSVHDLPVDTFATGRCAGILVGELTESIGAIRPPFDAALLDPLTGPEFVAKDLARGHPRPAFAKLRAVVIHDEES